MELEWIPVPYICEHAQGLIPSQTITVSFTSGEGGWAFVFESLGSCTTEKHHNCLSPLNADKLCRSCAFCARDQAWVFLMDGKFCFCLTFFKDSLGNVLNVAYISSATICILFWHIEVEEGTTEELAWTWLEPSYVRHR